MKRKKMIGLILAGTIGLTAATTTAGAGIFHAGKGGTGRFEADIAYGGIDAHDRDRGYDRRDGHAYRDRSYRRDRDEGARLFLYILSGIVDSLLKYERERPRYDGDYLPARLSKREIARRLERRDFAVKSVKYKARRDVYVVKARDPRGDRVRLVLDPYTGRIIRSRPVG